MTPAETTIVHALIAVAWADGNMEEPETGVIEALLAGFAADDDEESALLEYAKTPRKLDEVPIHELSRDDRELLLGNAALLVNSDGVQTDAEREILATLSALLEMSDEEATLIVESVRGGSLYK